MTDPSKPSRMLPCPAPGGPRRVLYLSPDPRHFEGLLGAVLDSPAAARGRDTLLERGLSWDELELNVVAVDDPDEAYELLGEAYANLLVVDLRWDPDQPRPFEAWVQAAGRLLTLLDHAEDVEQRYGFHRILVLVGDHDPEAVDELLLMLGRSGVGRVLRQRGAPLEGDLEAARQARFAVRVMETAVAMMTRSRGGRTALCAAGGGITGLFYEIGALKCLDDCILPAQGPRPFANAFDLYFGISAGAIAAGLLAVGYSVDELMASALGVEGGRIRHIDLRLVRARHVNWPDLRKRGRRALRWFADLAADVATGRRRFAVDAMVLELSELVPAPFRSDRFEVTLREILEAPGATNDFRELPRPLYIGASDQDLRSHVLFGEGDEQAVPISRAIQASLAIHPAFAAVRIGDRYLEDGAVTRTSNFSEAIARGASLVMVLDPFLPFVSKRPGYADERGVLYNIDADIRTVSFTRFTNTQAWVLRKHPEVSSYTFVPSNRLRRLLSANPMDHRPALAIWRGAYLSTLRRLETLCHRLRGDLMAHGFRFDPERARAVAARLRGVEAPTLADFFPDGRVSLRRPPLACEAAPALAASPAVGLSA